MEVNDALVDKLALLSRLRFNEEEKAELKQDLQKMIGFIDKLNEVNTEGVNPLLHITGNINNLRNDVVIQTVTREEALLNSPLGDKTFFKVPKVIKK